MSDFFYTNLPLIPEVKNAFIWCVVLHLLQFIYDGSLCLKLEDGKSMLRSLVSGLLTLRYPALYFRLNDINNARELKG